jgi:hypothetical protein
MRTRSTLLSFAAVLCIGLSDADAQKAPLTARPTARRTVAPTAPGNPLVKAHRATTGGTIAAPQRSRASAGTQRLREPTRLHQDAAHGSELRGGNPVNDACVNATALTVNATGGCPGGAVSGDNGAATSDNGTPACDASDVGFQDVWYSFNSGANTQIVIDLTMGTIVDIGIELLHGGCAGSSVFCNFNSLNYTVSVNTNTSYRLRVFSNNDFGAGGTFDICLSAAGDPPPNDLCEDAGIQSLNAPGSVTVNGDNTGATDTEGNGIPTVWEAFTINTCADVTISYCGTNPAFGNGFLNLRIGCPEVDYFLYSDFDTTSCADGNLTIHYTDVPAGTYYYAVLTEAGSVGPYTIEFSAVACGGGGTPPNDQCFNVVPASLTAGSSVFFNGTTENATSTNDGDQVTLGGDTGTVWHAFTTTECTDVTVRFCGTAVPPASVWIVLFDGCPAEAPGYFYSGINFTDCGDDNATIFYYGLPAGTWYLPILGEPGTWGEYTVEVSATACANAGPYCDAGAANTGFETIGNVLFSDIDNTSIGGPGYEDFTQVPGIVAQGQSYPIDITVDAGYDTDQALVWIDFDQSDSFEPGELVFTSTLGVGPYSGTVAIPSAAMTGSTRMRIRLHDTHDGTEYQNTPNYTPCDTSTYGQVEDYTIVVTTGGVGDFNDECSDATPLLLTTGATLTFTGDNTGCTDTEGLDFNNAWEAFTINECMNVTWDFCGSLSSMLVYTSIWSGCPNENFSRSCGDSPDIVCPNESTSPQVTAEGLPAGTYYIVIPFDSIWGGQYQINLTGTACTTPVPVNDECGGAISLTPANNCIPVTGTTAGATRSLPDLECAGYTGVADDDVWYSFTATTPGGEIHALPTEELDLVVQLYAGVCGGFTPLNCADAGLLGEEEVLVYTGLTVGTTYYYRVHGYYLGQQCDGFFSTCVTQDLSTGTVDDHPSLMRIVPNPTEGHVNIAFEGSGDNVRVEVLDVAGRLVQSEQRSISNGWFSFDLSGGISAGIYTLRLSTPEFLTEQRLLVK